jgi:hypothetical protein
VNTYYGSADRITHPELPGATMVDSSAFGTALWTAVIVAAFAVALSFAALSDMAMRRREDRAARERASADTARTSRSTRTPG